MTSDEVDETLRDIALTLGTIATAVEALARRLEALEGDGWYEQRTCYLEGCGQPAGVHGLCAAHSPKPLQ